MFKKVFVIIFTICFLTGCMPSPINKSATDKVQKNIIYRSLTNVGNTYRINKKIKAAKKGEKLILAFMSSSAFVDNNEDFSTVQNTAEQISSLFNKKFQIQTVNFSVYGTNSEFGNLMSNSRVLKNKPDVIFLDYAVFDGHEQEDRENFEALVRNCINQDNNPQVVILLNAKFDGNKKQEFMEQIAKYYNLPVIDVSTALLPEIAAGRMKAAEIFTEDNTFTELGKKYIADFCANYFKRVQKISSDKEYVLPQTMTPVLLAESPKFIEAGNIQAENDGSYIREKNDNDIFKTRIKYLSNTDNKPFIFILEANNIYLVAPVSSERNNTAEILINGKKTGEISSFSDSETDIPKTFKVYSGNKVEKVAVAIQQKVSEKITEEDNEEIQQEEDTAEPSYSNSDFEFWGIGYTKNQKGN